MSKAPCNEKDLYGVLETSDTEEVFLKLGSMEILNPLSTLYLLSAINSGEKIGSGHRIKF